MPEEQVIPMPLPVRRPEHSPTITALTPVTVPEQSKPLSTSIGLPLLEISRGPQAGTVFSVPPGVTKVGRDRDCAFTLDDPTVSRHHAEFQRTGIHVAVRDAGSLNGTYINGQPCDRTTTLVDGDEVWIGKFRLIFRDRKH